MTGMTRWSWQWHGGDALVSPGVLGRWTGTSGASRYAGSCARSMVGTVCGLVTSGSTLWGTRHPDSASAKSGTAMVLDTPLPFARMDKARDAPAPIHPQRGRSAPFPVL